MSLVSIVLIVQRIPRLCLKPQSPVHRTMLIQKRPKRSFDNLLQLFSWNGTIVKEQISRRNTLPSGGLEPGESTTHSGLKPFSSMLE